MTNIEIALQLTLSAIEHGHIEFVRKNEDANTPEQHNIHNAKQISDFYNSVLNSLKFR